MRVALKFAGQFLGLVTLATVSACLMMLIMVLFLWGLHFLVEGVFR